MRFIPKGTVVNNLGPNRLASPKALDSNNCRKPKHLIARPMSGSPKYFPSNTINAVYLA